MIAKDERGVPAYFYEGVELPDTVSTDERKRLVDLGMVDDDSKRSSSSDDDGAPSKSAPKSDWVDHAVSQGATREDAEASTKDELIGKYGS
ncbi:MAG: hypothetical protein LC798_10795 [Chloroflexi bacterium]|nr:hypothetical protein [Chloroflexota bacterium]